jgi:hypothetical protein
MSRDWKTITHEFGSGATLQKQVFSTGSGLRRFTFVRAALSRAERKQLTDFYNLTSGSLSSFTYNAPDIDPTTTTPFTVIHDLNPLSLTDLATMTQTGMTFLEIIDPTSPPTYPLNGVDTRFPRSSLATALLSEVQTIIPLFRIQVRDPAVLPLYLSDRRCKIGDQLYLPRVLSIGEPGSDLIMSQDISGRADNVQFTLGNADRAMSLFVQDTGLQYADVQFSLFHVNTAIRLDLWRGFIQKWQLDASSKFKIICSDGLYPITLAYPQQKISHQCYKKFNVAPLCPFDTQGASGAALVALGGDPHSCDYFFNTPNGCLAHGMSPFFGGHPAFPQSASIKDNGTGIIGGFLRDTVTATSIIADSMWGKVLPEIWCNDNGDPKQAFVANTIIAAVREESDFEDILGIVGAGPLGAYTGMSVQTTADGYKIVVSPLADGFTPQGFNVDSQLNVTGFHPELGLREVLGADPASKTFDFFSLGQGTPQHWDVPDPVFGNINTSQAHDILPFAAGTAFVEMRYAKSSGAGILPTNTDAHSMTIPISRGLTGISSASGTLTPGLTNPFWVAVSCLLRALGVFNTDPSVQTQYYIPESLFVGDGSGCAEIADLVVPALLGGGTETQFVFNGALSESKPFRDWLAEIISCALGIFSFEFGRLRLSIRENAAATSAFTLANMLFQSFSCTPIEASFESIRLLFANRALQYQNDQAEYTDKDHALYFGRNNAALQTDMRSVGMCNMSQALRVAATRVREEIGGILRPDLLNPYIEWDGARDAVFKSTILSLETYVGQVVSITHPDVPTYPGAVGASSYPDHTWNFRIRNWALYKDYSISFILRSVTDSMYDLDKGPKPTSVKPAPLPILYHPPSSNPAWAPNAVVADPTDVLFANERTFSLKQDYTVFGGTVNSEVIVSGSLPVTSPFQDSGAPDITGVKVTQATTGGFIKGGITLRVQFAAGFDFSLSGASKILIVQIPAGTNTNVFTVFGITWSTTGGPTPTAGAIFISDIDQLICFQQPVVLPATSFVVDGPFVRSTYAVPNTRTKKIRIKTRDLIHGGVAGAPIDALDSTSITCSQLVDISSTDSWAGRQIACIGRNNGEAPYFHANCTAFNPATGKLTLNRDPTAGVFPLLVGDVIVVCFSGYDNSSNQYAFSDFGLLNATNTPPHSGETIHDPNRIGNVVMCIRGLSRGLSAKIVDVDTNISYVLDQPLPLDATSIVVVVVNAWSSPIDSADFQNADISANTSISVPIKNQAGAAFLVGGFTVDMDDVESAEEFAPTRMLYSFGKEGAGINRGYYDIIIVAGHAVIDLANGLNQRIVLDGSLITVDAPIWTGGVITAGIDFTLYIDQDATGGRQRCVFTTGTPGFTADTNDENEAPIAADLSTRSTALFEYHGTLWGIDAWRTGGSIT